MLTMKRLLLLDFSMGFLTGLLGLLFWQQASLWLGFPPGFVQIVAAFNLLYALFALLNYAQSPLRPRWLLALVLANGAWTLLSLGFILTHYAGAQPLGKLFLLLQVPVLGGLTWAEGRQLRREG
jgi:hypothetical protein